MKQLKLSILLIIAYVFSTSYTVNSAESVRIQIVESDSVYFKDIKNLEFSPNQKKYLVNQKSKAQRINIYNDNGSIYKSYLIDDSYTDKFIESIKAKTDEASFLSTAYLDTMPGRPEVLYKNTISNAVFLTDSLLLVTSSINYYKERIKENGEGVLVLVVPAVFLIINIENDYSKAIRVYNNPLTLSPQVDYLRKVNDDIYFRILPTELLADKDNSLKYVLAKYDVLNETWKPILEVPLEYQLSKINLRLDYRYRIANNGNNNYFITPYTNYLFNLEGDTIKLSNLNNPIEFALNNTDSIARKLDDLKFEHFSSYIHDIFFENGKLFVLLSEPNNNYKNYYLNTYSMKGEFLKSDLINENQEIESAFFSNNKRKLFKIILENEKWYYEEVSIN